LTILRSLRVDDSENREDSRIAKKKKKKKRRKNDVALMTRRGESFKGVTRVHDVSRERAASSRRAAPRRVSPTPRKTSKHRWPALVLSRIRARNSRAAI